jgi:hypothetical protein
MITVADDYLWNHPRKKNNKIDSTKNLLYSQLASSMLLGQFWNRSQTRLRSIQYVSVKQSKPHGEYIPINCKYFPMRIYFYYKTYVFLFLMV